MRGYEFIEGNEIKYMKVSNHIFHTKDLSAIVKDLQKSTCLKIYIKDREFVVKFDSKLLRDAAFDYIWIHIQQTSDNSLNTENDE